MVLKNVFTNYDPKKFKIIIEYFCAVFYFLRDRNENSFILTYIVKNVVFDAARYS